MDHQLVDQELDNLIQSFQVIREQTCKEPKAREALNSALQEMAQAIFSLQVAREMEERHAEEAPGGEDAPVSSARHASLIKYILGTLPDSFVVIDRDFNVVMGNWKGGNLAAQKAISEGLKCYDMFHHRQDPCEDCHIPQILATGEPLVVEKIDHFSGKIYENSAFPILDKSGQVTMVAEHIRDITALRTTEKALQESEELYRVLTESSLAGVYLLQDHRFLYANPRMAQIFGYDLEEIINRLSPRDLIHPEDHPLLDEQIRRRLTGEVEEAHYAARGVRRDGRVINVEFLGRRVDYQGRPAIIGTLLDITERTRAEEEHREAEEKFRSIFDNATDGILITDPETRKFHLANPMIARMLGYSQEELQHLGIMDIHPPESLAYVLGQLEKQARQEFTVAPDIPVMRRDGSVFYADISASPFFIKGKLFLTGIFRDITERKEAAEALQTQALVLASMAEAVHAVNEEGIIVFANPATYAMFGYPEGELIGQPVTALNDLSPEESSRFSREIIEHLQRQGTWFGEVRNRRKDGTPFLASARLSTLKPNGKKLWISVQEDITARKHLEEATEGYLQFIRILLDTIPNPIFYKDAQGIILGCNKAFAEDLKVPQQDIPGNTVYDFFPGEVARRCDQADQEALEHPENMVKLEFEVPAPDGTLRHKVCHKAAFTEPSGSVGGVVSVTIDITDLQRAKEALRESEARYRAIIDNAQDVIFTKDRFSRYTQINPAVGRFFNHPVDRFVGLSEFDLFEEKDATRVLEEDQRVFNGETLISVNTLSIRNEPRTFHVVKVPLKDDDGQIVGLCGIARDITELQRTEEALKESEERYRLLADNVHDVLWMMDLNYKHTYISPSVKNMTGYTAEEFMSLGLRQIVLPAYHRIFGTSLEKLLAPEMPPSLSYEVEYRRKDDSIGWAEITVTLMRDSQDQVKGLTGVARDITLRKRAEEAVRESEARYRTLFETSPHGTVLMDLQMNIIMANQRGLRLFGFDRPEEVLGKQGLDFIVPEDRAKIMPLIQEMFETGESRTAEANLLKKDGTQVTSLITASLIRDVAGKTQAIIGVAQDISALKRAEEAVRESEARLRAIFEHAPVGITMVDHTGRFLQTNPAFQGIVGYSGEELRGMNFQQITYPEDLPENLRLQNELIAGQRLYYSMEKRLRRKDGEIVFINVMVARLHNAQGAVRVVGTIVDITARKRAEEALRESEQRFRLMAETIQDAFWIGTAEFQELLYVSPGYERIWGRSGAQILESPQAFLEVIHPEDFERVKAYLTAVLAQPVPWDHEYRIIKPNGEMRWIHDRGFPVKDGQGNVLMFTGVASDITERKTLEQQLLLAQKMEAVGRLAGGIAHDFNNLLMAITGYSELMQAKVLKNDPLFGYLRDIIKATDRAAALTGQLLTFSRRQIVSPEVVDLNRVVLEMDSMLRRLIEEDIELQIITAPTLGGVRVAPGSLNQIIMNLVINARDALTRGGRITLKTSEADFTANRQTRSGVAPPGPYVLLEVRDTGVGMDEAIQAHIFEPFFTTKDAGQGTGLGLSTVYGIVKQSGGFIDLDSVPGEGSTFKVYLPRLETVVKPRKTKRAFMEFRGKETILLVEDEDVLRALLVKFLRFYGYKVLEARHGGEALLHCERHQGAIDLMVTDVVMPQMSGRELADRLAPLRPEMRVLYMSGYTEDEVVRRGVADLSVAFLQKPFKPLELARQIHIMLHPQARG